MSLLNIWWLEMIACLLVLAMIGALVGTIYPYQGQPLPHWPYTLSINSIVAFYAEVMRVAMILVLGECKKLPYSLTTRRDRHSLALFLPRSEPIEMELVHSAPSFRSY